MLVVNKALWCRSSFVESEAVEVTLLPYARHLHSIPSCSAGILCLEIRRTSVFSLNTFCVSIIDWTFLFCVKIPDYICALLKVIGLFCSLILTYQFTLRRIRLFILREINKSRAAINVIFPVFLPNAWLQLLWQMNFVKGRGLDSMHVHTALPWCAVQCACRLVWQCVHRLHSVSLAVPWVGWSFNFSSFDQTKPCF